MAYTITNSRGIELGTILDGTKDDTTTSLTLIGRNYSNYGQFMVDNFVKLTENFARDISPSNPLAGQIWWDTSTSRLKVYTGSEFNWKIISSATAQATPPNTVNSGDIWWDTDAEQLYIYNGGTPYNDANWVLVGPAFNKTNGKSGAIWEQIWDGTLQHNVLSLYLDGDRIVIISDDEEFTPATPITGFTTIKRGANHYNLGIINGTAYTADRLGDVVAANYLRTDIDNTATGNLRIVNNQGITVGANLDLTVSAGSSSVAITNNINDSNIDFFTKSDNVLTKAIYIDAATSELIVAGDPVSNFAVATKQYVDNSFIDAELTGIPTAPTAAPGTASAQVATTAYVMAAYNPANIYQLNSSLTISDTGSNGSINLVLDGVSVLSGSSGGIVLANGATATTQAQTVNDGTIATTAYVRTATQRWDGSAKFVSTSAPNPALGNDGDFWFQREA